jgi:hypothetical protein
MVVLIGCSGNHLQKFYFGKEEIMIPVYTVLSCKNACIFGPTLDMIAYRWIHAVSLFSSIGLTIYIMTSNVVIY